jgi:hypothetical protein
MRMHATPLHVLAPAAIAALLCVGSASAEPQSKPAKTAAPAKPATAAAAKPATPAGRGAAAPAGRAGGAATPAGRGATPAAGGRGTTPASGGRGTTPAAGGRGTTPATGGRGATGAAAGGRGSGAAAGGRGSGATAGGRGANASAARGSARVPAGGREVHTANGGHATFDRGGHPRDVHARGMEIHHGPGGGRTIVRERPGGVRVVSNHYGHGYIAHPYAYHGVAYMHRTYYYNGVAYSRFYRPYAWGGVPLNVYAPGAYFVPAYYGWAYNPWAVPVAYSWGWAANPWYGYYGGWFAPYPTYAGPAFWLTDYLVSQTLMAAYQERAAGAAAAANYAATPMTPDVKNLIADEVKRQLALESQEAGAGSAPDPASSGIARMLADNQPHIFVAGAGLDVTSTNGECFVTEGDVLRLQGSVPPGSPAANLMVMASKGQDCARGSMVQVQVSDLQDMQNHMRETLDQGLGDLQNKQGQNGIPAAPSTVLAAAKPTEFAQSAPPPDPNVKTELSAQAKEADQAEQEVLQEAASGPNAGGGPSAPPSAAAPPAPPKAKKLDPGMSIDQVKAAMGEPKEIVDAGVKQIYIYDAVKLTLVNGKLTKIE